MSKLTASTDVSNFLAAADKDAARLAIEAASEAQGELAESALQPSDPLPSHSRSHSSSGSDSLHPSILNQSSLTLIVDSDNSFRAYPLDSIGSYAFAYDSGIGLSVGTGVTSIGDSAFNSCSGFTGSLVIPDSVTSIGDYAFRSCSGFTGSLTIGDSVTSIGSYAFYNCTGFTGSLVIPDSVTSIGSYAFRNCSGFTGSLIIPDSVTFIGNYAFDACSGFTGSLTIPDSVTSIGSYAFAYCSGFTGSLTIGNSVTTIADRAFTSCAGLTNVDCYVTRDIMDESSGLLEGTSVTTLHARASDSTWTAGADTIGGKSLTVIKDL